MKYGFYPGCAFQTESGCKASVEAVSRHAGIELNYLDDWNCCGATVAVSLSENDGLVLPARNFALASRQGLDTLITTCNACYTSLKKAHKMISKSPAVCERINHQLAGQGLAIERLPEVRHLLDVLVHDIPETTWNMRRETGPVQVAAYYGCQFTRPWEDLGHPERPDVMETFFSRLGLAVVDHSARTLCCGASHFFPYESDCLPLIGRIIGEMRRKGAQVIGTICPMCQLNLEAAQAKLPGKPLPVLYFTQLAGLALGMDPESLDIQKLVIPADEYLKAFKRI